MRRRFPMLLGPLFCALSLTLTLNTFGQTAPSSTVEVAYVLTSDGIQVYDVDRQTGIPTFEGLATVPLKFAAVVPSADDHFVYVYGSNAISGGPETFYVYPTDSTGMLSQSAIQKLNLPNPISYFTISPNGTFAYAVVSKQDANRETLAGIVFFTLDPATGRVTAPPKLVASYPPNGPCGSAFSASLGLVGISPSGDRLYEKWFCVGYDDNNASYYTRSIDHETGALGADVLTLSAGGSNGSFSVVNFTPKVILDYYVEADFFNDTLYIYPLNGGVSPIFSCTAAMLAACGASGSDRVEPSGNYIFFSQLSGTTAITKLDLQANEIVDTGNSFPDGVTMFSPDSALIYTESDGINPFIFPIYTFDLARGAASRGGQIVIEKSQFASVVPALRK